MFVNFLVKCHRSNFRISSYQNLSLLREKTEMKRSADCETQEWSTTQRDDTESLNNQFTKLFYETCNFARVFCARVTKDRLPSISVRFYFARRIYLYCFLKDNLGSNYFPHIILWDFKWEAWAFHSIKCPCCKLHRKIFQRNLTWAFFS